MYPLWSRKIDGSTWAAPPASLFTLYGADHVRPPSRDFEKKMSCWVVEPPHPPYARYRTPAASTAIEGWYPRYAGGAFTIVFGPNHGAVAPTAAGTGTATARRLATPRVAMRAATRVRDAAREEAL